MPTIVKRNYLTILEILKSGIDDILKDYKNLKQKMLRKMKKKETFYKTKEEFIIRASIGVGVVPPVPGNKRPEVVINAPKQSIVPVENITPVNDDLVGYRESPQVIHIFKENESKNLERTKQTLFELSDLMTNFSTKVQQHHEITQNSI
jgi:hypothetical protein